jgi:hypothetical protein
VTERGTAIRTRLQEAIQEVPESLAALSEEDQRALLEILRRALG